MPDFGHPFSGLAKERKLTDAELIRAIRFMVSAEYEAIQLYMQLEYSGVTEQPSRLKLNSRIAETEHPRRNGCTLTILKVTWYHKDAFSRNGG